MSWNLEFEHRVGVLGRTAPHYLPGCRKQRTEKRGLGRHDALIHLCIMLTCCLKILGLALKGAAGCCKVWILA